MRKYLILRLITLFSGYDSQKLAFNYLGIDVEHYRAVEFDKYAIQSLNDIHNTNFPTLDITKVKGTDLGIENTKKYTYVMTYSFPCTDLSLAGKRAGMEKGSNTRSGLLWEVERLLNEVDNLPHILIMENVPQVLNSNGWREWCYFLESKRYSNYAEVLNAKNYGIPQNRERCFMVSILGIYNYKFPKGFELKYRLKDLLESNVDESYYLSDKMIDYIMADNEKWTGNNNHSFINKSIASTINAGEGGRRADASNFVSTNFPEDYDLKNHKGNKRLLKTLQDNDIEPNSYIDTYNNNNRKDGCSGTITAGVDFRNSSFIAVPEATKQGFAVAGDGDGDGVYINRPHQKRGCVQKGMIQTLKTSCADVGVVIGSSQKNAYVGSIEGESPSLTSAMGMGGGHIPMIVKNSNNPKVLGGIGEKNSNGGTQWYQQDRIYDNKISMAVTSAFQPNNLVENNQLRIRKLTPLEVFKLMGVKPSDYEKLTVSKSQRYTQAGNSIVTTCLMAIYSQLFDNVDYRKKIDELLEELID